MLTNSWKWNDEDIDQNTMDQMIKQQEDLNQQTTDQIDQKDHKWNQFFPTSTDILHTANISLSMKY